MIAPIPQKIKDQNNEQQENTIPEKIFSFSDIFQENEEEDENEGEEQKRQPIIYREDRIRLVQENTKRIYASKDEEGKQSARVLDCITRQLFYEKQCSDQNEYDYITTNILTLYEKIGGDLDDLINIVKDIDDEKLRIYYENGVINFRQLCDYNLKQRQYWFNQQGQLKSIFKQTFLILHQLFENSFYFGNLSMESISFCKQKGGNKGLVVKLMDIGYGSFEFNEILKAQLRNKNSIEIEKEEDRRIFELQILGYLFEEVMLESVIEYENSLLAVFSEIGQKPENCPMVPDIYQQPAEKVKKIQQYYQKDILTALKAIREGVDYNEIFESVVNGILLEVDEQTEDINVYDQENQFQRNLQEKVSEIEKDINNKEEFLAYLQILKTLDMWKLGVKILKQNQDKYPHSENLNILYESLYFYRMAGEDCICLGESAKAFVEDYKKEKDDYFKIMIFCVFCETDPEKYADIHQESVDHFQLADDPPNFAWIQYMLGQIYTVLKKEDFAFQFLEKASQLYDTINIEDDEKGQCYELYQQYVTKPSKRLNVLNKAYQVFQNKKLYEGQRYGDLMEAYGDTYKQMGIAKSQEQQQAEDQQEGQEEQQQQQQDLQSPTQQPDIVDIDYETMYDFYLISHTVYEFSMGKNNEHSLRLHNKICNTTKFFQDLTLYVNHTIDFILLDDQEPDPAVISELTSLVIDQEFLLACLKERILDKAELYEGSHKYQEAQKLVEGCLTILQTFENELLNQVKYQLEIIRLKHMYHETNKEFLLTEGFEKALSVQDKNYFFKRWNINLIVKGELKQSLKSIETNQPECEDNVVDQAEFFILRTAIFKKMEKFDRAEEQILKAQIIVEDNDIYYLSQFVKDQIHYIQFLAQEQLENRLEYNQKKYKKMLKQKSCQEQEILRLQMNCAFIHELQSNYKQSRDIVSQVLDQSSTQQNNRVQKSAKTTLNRLYEKKLMAQLEKQQRYTRPSTAFI